MKKKSNKEKFFIICGYGVILVGIILGQFGLSGKAQAMQNQFNSLAPSANTIVENSTTFPVKSVELQQLLINNQKFRMPSPFTLDDKAENVDGTNLTRTHAGIAMASVQKKLQQTNPDYRILCEDDPGFKTTWETAFRHLTDQYYYINGVKSETGLKRKLTNKRRK